MYIEPWKDLSLGELRAYVAEERKDREIIERWHRAYGWRTRLIWNRQYFWYSVRESLSEWLSVSDEANTALCRVEAQFLGYEAGAMNRTPWRKRRS